jgi:hypothetical protein
MKLTSFLYKIVGRDGKKANYRKVALIEPGFEKQKLDLNRV